MHKQFGVIYNVTVIIESAVEANEGMDKRGWFARIWCR